MKGKKRKNDGFTLVELMVVAVIVAILAAVAIPLMSANKDRAIMTEAQAALGTVRSVLRAQYAETGEYSTDINDNPLSAGTSVTNIPGIRTGDLNGRWWSEECYTLTTVSSTEYLLTADGSASIESKSPKAAEVATLTVTLDHDGTFNLSDL